MFNSILQNIDDTITKAKSSEKLKQSEYFPIYETIETYIKDNDLVLSNVDILVSEKITNKRYYVIYGPNIFKHANNLANSIAKLTIHVLMFTNKQNEDFSITVNGSPLIQLYNLYSKLREAIAPVKINDMFMYPPEFELIDIYHKLYLPNYANDWDKYTQLRLKLEDQLQKRRDVIGGKPKHRTQRPFNANILLNWLLKNKHEYVLIGDNAINTLLDKPKNLNKVQIISPVVDKFMSEVGNFIKQYTGFLPTFKTHNANTPIEPRIRKTVVSITLKVKGKSRIVHILDIFNNAEYELIPYTKYKGLNIAYPNVLKMFQLLDLWYLRILKALGKIDDIKSITSSILHNLETIGSLSDTLYRKEFYIGINYDTKMYKKIQGTGNKFYPYNPEQYRYLNGNYRHI